MQYVTIRALALALAFSTLAFGAPAATPPRFDFDRTPGRLSKQVVPSRYAIALDLDPQRDDFEGRVDITLDVRRAVAAITLQASELTARDAVLAPADAPGDARPLRVSPDAAAMTWTLAPADGRPVAAGTYRLRIAYRGVVHATGSGLYRADFRAGGVPQRWLATQLEEIHARTLFPGFDEPAFRAVFELDVRAPRGVEVVSNMPQVSQQDDGDASTRHRFAPTPPMPSYLVAVAVGTFDALEGSADGVPLRVLTAPGKRAQARFALDTVSRLLPYYGAYFGIPYALPKLDLLAVPSVRDGAMEDWGLISYIEPTLLVDAATSGPQTERQVFTTVAHEVAHQWFGDLVTASYWDEIWLNEAFASWMEVKAADRFNPRWQVRLNTRADVDAAMLRDAGPATRAIRSGPVDETRVSDQFDDITYTKGGAVLSMLEQWIGPEAFQRGLAAYMHDRRLSNATAGDLWAQLSRASGGDVGAVAASWTDQPGLPLVRLHERCVAGRSVLEVAQQRFTNDGTRSPQRWRIPLRLARGGVERELLLERAAQRVDLGACSDEAWIANAGGRGFYRVAYDAAARQRLAAGFARLAPIDRVTLLSDAFALAQAGVQPMDAYVALLARLPDVQGSGREALFALAGEQLRELDDTLAGTPAQARLRDAARRLLAPELARLGWEPAAADEPETLRLRAALVGLLARFGDADVRRHAVAAFDGDAPLPPSLRPSLLLAVALDGDAARFERLRQRLLHSEQEEERWFLLDALAASPDAAQIDTLLQTALDGALPPNVASWIPAAVGAHPRFAATAYAFVRAHWAALAKLAGPPPDGGSSGLLPQAAAGFAEARAAARLVADQRRLAGAAGRAQAATAAAKIRLRAAVRARAAGLRFAALEAGR